MKRFLFKLFLFKNPNEMTAAAGALSLDADKYTNDVRRQQT